MDGPCSPRLKISPQTENGGTGFSDRPRGHRGLRGGCRVWAAQKQRWPVVWQRNNPLSSLLPPLPSTFFLPLGPCLIFSFPSPLWPLLFLPWSSLSPPPSYWKQLGLWWLRTGLVEGREAGAVYRNWSSSIHQLCLELETKHNKYLGSSPAVLSLNLAI